ncbi:MAG: DUF2513 domain-containing protein [Leptolyngbyaceae cyanobacterium]
MERDLELWKKILLKVEELPIGNFLSSPVEIEGYEQAIVTEHVRLLQEKRYIEAKIDLELLTYDLVGAPRIEGYEIYRLLNDGHDFVANAKNPTVWKKTVNFLAQKGGGGSLAILQGVLTRVASEHFLGNI